MRARRAALAALACAGLTALAPKAARADDADDARVRAKVFFDAAESAVAERRYRDAMDAYRAAVDADPAAPFASAARTREGDLAAHAEGDFAPLRRLDEIRSDPAALRDRTAVDALERDAAAFPPGRVRSEARLVVAEARWHGLDEPERALAPLEAIAGDTSADHLSRAFALNELVAIDRSLGNRDAAISAVDRFPELAPLLRADLHRALRRDRLRIAAVTMLLSLAAVGAISAARVATRRGVRAMARSLTNPAATAVALSLGAGGAVIARLYGAEDPRPFLVLGLGLLALDVVARTLRLATPTPHATRMRALRTAIRGAGGLAVAFLAIDLTHAAYLARFGL